MNRVVAGLMAVGLAAALPACSGKQAYEGLQAGKRAQCIKLPEPDRSRCVESTSLDHDDYERQRGSQ